MIKASSYFLISMAIIVVFGAAFYILTAENIDFFGEKKSAPRSILPSLPVDNAEKVITQEIFPTAIVTPGTQPKKEVRSAPIQKPESTPPLNESGSIIQSVSLEPDGFKPRIVVIYAGDTVKWINNDMQLHWPASDPHPTHTGLAGFDPLADLLPGESFSFTFNSVGVYGYHDHTLAVVAGIATLTGIVRVLPLQ